VLMDFLDLTVGGTQETSQFKRTIPDHRISAGSCTVRLFFNCSSSRRALVPYIFQVPRLSMSANVRQLCRHEDC
jgi:hypothetical protein